jgi:hypothetical protein
VTEPTDAEWAEAARITTLVLLSGRPSYEGIVAAIAHAIAQARTGIAILGPTGPPGEDQQASGCNDLPPTGSGAPSGAEGATQSLDANELCRETAAAELTHAASTLESYGMRYAWPVELLTGRAAALRGEP